MTRQSMLGSRTALGPAPEHDELETNTKPHAITPPPHTAAFHQEEQRSGSTRATPRTPRVHLAVVTPLPSPSSLPSASTATPRSPISRSLSKKHVAKAFYGSDAPPAAQNTSPRHRWAVSAGGYNGIFDASSANAVVLEADRRGADSLVRQVESISEVEEWFSRLELASETSSEQE
ncbi:hypothetical protein VKT23_011940 [Stygiomarasmius scandens]|uniref:Uncharacterized protein n=1 Tax=Marasmiellus scandens TaxID=2682957 RepID=A0ABR1J863_9AGAR